MSNIGSKLLGYSGNDNYVIHNNEKSIEFLEKLSENILFRNTQLGKILTLLDNQNDYKEIITVSNMVNILESSFIKDTLFTKYEGTLHILCLNYGFKDKTNAKAFHDGGILINAKNYSDNSPIESFLHELGHFFHIGLSGNINQLPKDIRTFIFSDNITNDIFLPHYWNLIEERASYDVTREKFADLFMIAYLEYHGMINNTMTISSNVHPVTRNKIKNFFSKLYLK